MSITRRTDKEDAARAHTHAHTHTHPTHKNEIMPFAATQKDLKIIILSEITQRGTNITSLTCGI